MNMTVENTIFKMRASHLVTYKSGPSKTQVDFYFVLKDKKVLPSVEFITQHKLLVCDFKESKRCQEKNCTLEKDIEIT